MLKPARAASCRGAVSFFPAMTFEEVMAAHVWEPPPRGVHCAVVRFFAAAAARYAFVVPLTSIDDALDDLLRRAGIDSLPLHLWVHTRPSARELLSRLQALVGVGYALPVAATADTVYMPPGHVACRVVNCEM
jgi:hypothetical protein